MNISKSDYEKNLSYYMRISEDKLLEKYYEIRKNINKRLGCSHFASLWARQEIYEIEQALKKRGIEYKK